MKQQLISSGLAVADFIHRHPKRITAVIAAFMLGGGGGAFAVASLAPTAPTAPLRLVSESVEPQLGAQTDILDTHSFTLYRSESTRSNDTPEALLKRLGLADPAAAAFLRKNETTRQALFGRFTRLVTAEASDRQELLKLQTHWLDKNDDENFKRLVVEKAGDGFSVRVEPAPLVANQRIASGTIRGTLFAATDEANLPDSVTKQLTEIFESNVDFHRGLRRGDRFSVVYETLEADGETMRAGKILSAEVVNRGRTHQAIWFKEQGATKGAYYTPDGQSLRKAYLLSPMEVSRITSGFGMRNHPVYGYSREHNGVDYAAPTGTPVRTIGDGVVTFAGVQNGYGNVIQIRHRNAKDSTLYAHLSRIDVKVGDNVMQGEKIGAVGSTGVSTGPHLHFEFRIDNTPQDPTEVLAEQREYVPVSPGGKAAFAKWSSGMKMQLTAAGEITRSSFE
ncbi:MAG TPA: peptidoglycan DD-metalloendopeptidase family protein [Ottowia beijingensis]|nr:peptidoglycan DD-metalloendopeptidase family protein [Ottowia beijingensis]